MLATNKQAGGVAKILIGLILIVIIALGVWYFTKNNPQSDTEDQSAGSEEAAEIITSEDTLISASLIEGIDLQANADDAAITVNGESITNQEVQGVVEELRRLFTLQGQTPTGDAAETFELTEQAVNLLVNTRLMVQAAAAEGVSVTAEEIEAEIAVITEGAGGADALQTQLTEIGLTTDKLRENIRNDMLIQNLLDSVITPDLVAVSDEEVQAFYDENKELDENIPDLEEVRQVIVDQLAEQKRQDFINGFVEGLRNNAVVQ